MAATSMTQWIHELLLTEAEVNYLADAIDSQNELAGESDDEDNLYSGIDIRVRRDQRDKPWPRITEIASMENYSPDVIGKLFQGFLSKFRPTECIAINVCFTCDRDVPGAFGGGAIFITADEYEVLDSFTWLASKKNAFRSVNPPRLQVD